MTTEQDIIYSIWETVRSGEINQDDNISERLLRAYLSSHRGKHLLKNYTDGAQLPDEVYQDLGNIYFSLSGNDIISTNIPKAIRMPYNFGILARKDSYLISVVNDEEFLNSQKDDFNKYHPKLKLINNRLYLYKGIEQLCDDEFESYQNTVLNKTVRKLNQELKNNQLNLNIRAVLVNPDDEVGYDWTRSPYPFPDEYLEDLINSVNARDFNLYLRTRSDEIGDQRDNNTSYNSPQEL